MKKHDMVPEHSFFEALATCLIAITPKDHYKRLDEGSIVLKKSKTFSFCKEGVVVEGESSPIKSDIVIFGTGFKGDQKITNMFTSEYFQSIAVGPISSTVPLYRLLHYYYLTFVYMCSLFSIKIRLLNILFIFYIQGVHTS